MYVTEAMTIRLCVNAIASLTTSANARDFRASRASRRRVPATRLLSNSLLNRLSPRWSPSPSARETPYGTTTRDASRGGREGGTGDLTAVEVETPRDRPRIACTRWCGTVCGEGIAWSRPRPWGDEGVSTLSPCTASRRCSPRLRTTARSPVWGAPRSAHLHRASDLGARRSGEMSTRRDDVELARRCASRDASTRFPAGRWDGGIGLVGSLPIPNPSTASRGTRPG